MSEPNKITSTPPAMAMAAEIIRLKAELEQVKAERDEFKQRSRNLLRAHYQPDLGHIEDKERLRAELEQAKAVIHEAGITIGSDGRVEVDLDGERFIPRAQADKMAKALKAIKAHRHLDIHSCPCGFQLHQALKEWEQAK